MYDIDIDFSDVNYEIEVQLNLEALTILVEKLCADDRRQYVGLFV